MNAPNRYELYVLEEGEKPCVIEVFRKSTQVLTECSIFALASVEITEDTKIPNAATIKIVKQDHTLGNMLRA